MGEFENRLLMIEVFSFGNAKDYRQHLQFNYKEVVQYIPILSSKRQLPPEDLYLALSMLPVSVYDEAFYQNKIRQAKKLMAKRDPDDHHLLALALKLNCPVWSNDKDFHESGIDVYSTMDLLRLV